LTADFKGTVGAAFGGMLTTNGDTDLRKWLVAKAQSQDQKMAVDLIHDLWTLDASLCLKDVKVPVRCINSAGGYLYFTPTAINTNQKYADYDAVSIPDVGHFIMLEKPAEFNQKFRELVKELASK